MRDVIDPESNVDVIRMKFIENLVVDDEGKISYTFRPSSPLCPLAVTLVNRIKRAVGEVPGITDQQICIRGYVAAEELTRLINEEE